MAHDEFLDSIDYDAIIYDVVEQTPSFMEGDVKKGISRNIEYPTEAVKSGIQGMSLLYLHFRIFILKNI